MNFLRNNLTGKLFHKNQKNIFGCIQFFFPFNKKGEKAIYLKLKSTNNSKKQITSFFFKGLYYNFEHLQGEYRAIWGQNYKIMCSRGIRIPLVFISQLLHIIFWKSIGPQSAKRQQVMEFQIPVYSCWELGCPLAPYEKVGGWWRALGIVGVRIVKWSKDSKCQSLLGAKIEGTVESGPWQRHLGKMHRKDKKIFKRKENLKQMCRRNPKAPERQRDRLSHL